MISHSLLLNQIRKTLGDERDLSPEMQALLKLVSQTYFQHDVDREFFHETMDLNTKELTRVNEALQQEYVKRALVLDNLKQSIESLDIVYYDHDLSDEDLLSLSNILAEQIAMRNLAEELLLEQDESLRIIVEGTKDFVFYSINIEGIISNWNSSAERITGYTISEAIGQHFSIFFPMDEDSRQQSAQILRQTKIAGKTTHEGWLTAKDGRTFWGETTLTAIFDDAKNLRSYVSVTQDITARKAAEEELRKAKEEAEAATRAKSEFLANMSHEIRTPMNGVIGMASLLMDTNLNEEQQDYVQVIQSSGESLLAIINDILDFSKIEAGQIEIEEYPFCLRTCIEEACDLVANRLRNKNVELIYELSPDTPRLILSDPTRLRQILINLLGNAVKFTADGEIVVSTKIDEKRAHDLLLQVSVRDTGIGIPPDKMGRLFNAFSQVDASTTRKYGGTGLGLSICSQLSDLMGGRIWAESKEHEGATFHFTIAIKEAPTHQEPAPKPAFLAGKKILLIEDNATLCDVLTKQFETWGASVKIFDESADALHWIKRNQCDVVLIDNRILEPSKPLQNYFARKDAKSPVLVLVPIGERIRHNDRLSVLQKPVKYQVLADKLDGLLKTASEVRVHRTATDSFTPPQRILVIEENSLDQRILKKMLNQFGHEVNTTANPAEERERIARAPYDVVLFNVESRNTNIQDVRALLAGTPMTSLILLSTEPPEHPDQELAGGMGRLEWITKPINLQKLQQSLLRLARKSPIQKVAL